ncbi:unnamed protein product, partial [Symbiodinium sp. CCMP2456]
MVTSGAGCNLMMKNGEVAPPDQGGTLRSEERPGGDTRPSHDPGVSHAARRDLYPGISSLYPNQDFDYDGGTTPLRPRECQPPQWNWRQNSTDSPVSWKPVPPCAKDPCTPTAPTSGGGHDSGLPLQDRRPDDHDLTFPYLIRNYVEGEPSEYEAHQRRLQACLLRREWRPDSHHSDHRYFSQLYVEGVPLEHQRQQWRPPTAPALPAKWSLNQTLAFPCLDQGYVKGLNMGRTKGDSYRIRPYVRHSPGTRVVERVADLNSDYPQFRDDLHKIGGPSTRTSDRRDDEFEGVTLMQAGTPSPASGAGGGAAVPSTDPREIITRALQQVWRLLKHRRRGTLRQTLLQAVDERAEAGFRSYFNTRVSSVWDEQDRRGDTGGADIAEGLEVDQEWMRAVVDLMWDEYREQHPADRCERASSRGAPSSSSAEPPRRAGPPPPEPVRYDPPDRTSHTNDSSEVSTDESDAVSAMQALTWAEYHDEPDRRWRLRAWEIRDDIDMMLRNMVWNGDQGEACYCARSIYRLFLHTCDTTSTRSRSWVEAEVGQAFRPHLFRVPNPWDFELDPDMQGWLTGIKDQIVACANLKHDDIMAYRERVATRKRRREQEATQGRPGSSTDVAANRGEESEEHFQADDNVKVPSLQENIRTMTAEYPPTATSTAVTGDASSRWETAQQVTSSEGKSQCRHERLEPRHPEPVDPAAPLPLSVAEAVDLWRQLLGLSDNQNMGDMDRAVESGGRVIPRSAADNAVDTMREYDRHDLAILTIGLVELVRRLIAEGAQILAASEEDLVEVEVERADGHSLMQMSQATCKKTFKDQAVVLQEFQVAWAAEAAGRASGLKLRELQGKAKRYRLQHGPNDVLDLFDALLVTMQVDLEQEVEGTTLEDGEMSWLQTWWERICRHMQPPTSGSSGSGDAVWIDPREPEEGEALAAEEVAYMAEERCQKLWKQAQEAQHDAEEEEYDRHMQQVWESHVREAEAQRWQSWDDWAMFDEMRRPPKRRRSMVELQLGPPPGASGVETTTRMPLPLHVGDGLQVLRATVVGSQGSEPSEGTTEPVESMELQPPKYDITADEQQQVTSPPASLDFHTYQQECQKLRDGLISEAYVLAMWGEAALDLMQAEMTLADMEEDDGVAVEGSGHNQLDNDMACDGNGRQGGLKGHFHDQSDIVMNESDETHTELMNHEDDGRSSQALPQSPGGLRGQQHNQYDMAVADGLQTHLEHMNQVEGDDNQ